MLYIIPALVIPLLLTAGRFLYSPSTRQKYIRDDKGRIQFLRGVNANSTGKDDPERLGKATKEDYARLSRDWGLNAVRFLLFWDAIEPEKGRFDETYLQKVRERLDWCEEAGLKVILDMHQDLFSSKFGGDGAPDWAIHDGGHHFVYQRPWEKNYIHPAVRTAIGNFWKPEAGHPELQEHFIEASLHALTRLADHGAVLGIDLYNEPTMATLQGLFRFERRYLSPFLQKMINRIRENHPDLWLFFEPSALGPNQGFRTDLKQLKDPRNGEKRLAYFPHIYTLDLDVNGRYAGWPFHLNFWAKKRKSESRRFDVPMLVGEFGLEESKPGALDFLREATDMFDRVSSGWFYWAFDEKGGWGLLDKEGNEQNKCAVLVRPYPRCIAGNSPVFSWNQKEQLFQCRYTSTGKDGTSELVLPERCWPQGWTLDSEGQGISWEFDEHKNILYIKTDRPGPVSVTVRKKETT